MPDIGFDFEVRVKDYVRTARSIGLRMSAVYNRHALRNALSFLMLPPGRERGSAD